MSKLSTTAVRLGAVVVAAAGLSTGAQAAFTAATGSSNAHGLQATVNLLPPLVGLNVGPAALTQGTAPSAYSLSNSVASVSGNLPTLVNLGTGLVVTNASSNVNGGAGARQATASATVNNLGLRVLPNAVALLETLNLGATTITSTSTVSTDGNTVTYAGSSIIEGLNLRSLGVTVPVGASFTPNSVIFNALGISIIANQQIIGGDGITSRTLETNALRISINSVPGIANGDIIVGHSFASLAIPSPSGAAALCFAGACVAVRRRRRPDSHLS